MTTVRSDDSELLTGDSVESFDAYLARGNGKGLASALALRPADVVSEVTKARLRGRGGGVSTGLKWASVARDACPTKYVVCTGLKAKARRWRHTPTGVVCRSSIR